MGDTQRLETVSTKLQQIAEQAKDYPERVFTSLVHMLDVEFLREAWRQTKKDKSPGIDGITAKEYERNLEENLRDLHERMRSGKYRATPVKRVWLEKADGSKRPIGKPAFEDKIVQRAVTMLLEAVYEQDFYDFSHGFRKGHSPHHALQELRERCMSMNIHWVVDADVSGFFDNLDHGMLREMIRQRINDGGVIRLIGKFLNAGVMEGEILTYSDRGTPQGGVISPMLANIFLHHVLDEWYEKQIKPRLKGRSFLIRFADDFIIGCELGEDARRVMEVLPKRFNRYGLTVHPEKTVVVRFGKPNGRNGDGNGNGTFEFLGFSHHWAKSRRGNWVIKRMTASKRMRRTMKAIWEWCDRNRHMPLKEQSEELSRKMRGHYQYYGIRGNYKMLETVFEHAEKSWRYWLSRRSHKGKVTGEKFEYIRENYPLPRPRIVHSI